MRCYLCSVISGSLTLLEHEATSWLDREHLPSVKWLTADIEVLDEIKECYKMKKIIAPFVLDVLAATAGTYVAVSQLLEGFSSACQDCVYVGHYRYHISMYFPASKPLCRCSSWKVYPI